MSWFSRGPGRPRRRNALAIFQAAILATVLVAPAAVFADEPPIDPAASPPATEPASSPPVTDPAVEPSVEPAPVDPGTDPAVEPSAEPSAEPAPVDPAPVEPAIEPAPEPPAQQPAFCVATGHETIATDLFDYAPEETVSITGTGYAASCDVVVRVTRPDGSIVVGDGSFAVGSDAVATTASGNLAYDYILDGIQGEYLIDVLGDGDTILASALFSDSVPSGAGALFADAAGTVPKQAFQVGDTIYARFNPVTTPDNTARYKFVLVQPNGTEYAASTTACLTPDPNGVVTGAQLVTQTAFSTVSGTRWTERLYVYANAGCTGAASIRNGQTFHVFQSFAYDSLATRDACNSDATCAATTPAFAPGDDIYLRIAVSQANRAPSGMRFIKPDGVTVACTVGFLGSDANGAMSFTYPSVSCPVIGSTASDIGLWTMDVSAVLGGTAASTTFFPQSTTNIPAFLVKAPLTVTTAVHDRADSDVTGGSVALGTPVHDTASLTGLVTGLVPAPVVFTFYPDATCTEVATTVAVDGTEGAAIKSGEIVMLGAGDYSFKATVAENGSYFGDESPCEPFTVNRATPTVVTEMHLANHAVVPSPSAVPFGSVIHDKAIVTAVNWVEPTGTVTFQLFSGSANCSGPLLSTETVPVGTESSPTPALPFGRYTYLASYSGDANYIGPVSAGCEIVETNKGEPSITTDVHAGTNHATDIQGTAVPLGTIAHDQAIVTGLAGIGVTGMVRFELFGNDACTAGASQPITTETIAVGTESTATAALGAGSYSYLATYLGDGNYRSATADCESFTVNQATPTIRTEVHSATHVVLAPPTSAIPLGSVIHDSAILGGQVDGIAIGGTVTYTVYRTAFGEPAQNCAGPIFKAAETVAAGSEMTSTGALATGRYTIRAVYSGDANYLPVTAACEIFEVTTATPTIVTQVHRAPHIVVPSPSAVALGSVIHDSAILGGQVDGFVIDGTVTYTVYRTAFGEPAQNCTGDVFAGPWTIAVGSETINIGPLATGRYTIKAVYGGNSNYNAATAACEIFEVAKATPRVETVVRLEAEGGSSPVSNPGVVALGSTVHDRAFVVGKVDGFDFTGTVTFTLFTGAQNCAGSVIDGPEEVTLGSPTESSSFGPLTAGRYSYLATYNGNDNYTSASGPCEIFEVSKGATSTTTELHEGLAANEATHIVIPVGGFTFAPNVHDKATVTGAVSGVAMTGQVQYIFFDKNLNPYASVCDGQPRLTETKNIGEESSDKTNLPPGQYAFRARYLGDANYAASWSSCEPFTVVPNNAVTSSSLCTFDVDSTRTGSQFRLIYTPDMSVSAYKLNASNPGQFFYNVFYTGAGDEDITLTIPAPFQTQGATPVHVYAGVTPVTVDGVTCYTAGDELTGAAIDGAPITGTGGGTITVTLPTLSSGFAYIAVHLDYGFKKILTGCTKGAAGEAICTDPLAETIANNEPYGFGFTNSSSGTATVYSINEFKKNPGIGGFLHKGSAEDPVDAASVEIWLGTKKMGTVKSDADGWFMWSYKYTGKPVTFTVKVPALGLSQSATLKSNGFLVFTFNTP